MARLKSRQQQIPNGLKFFESITGWDSVKQIGSHPSFERLVDAVLTHRKGNPRYAGKWKLTRAGVESDVESYNVRICEANGWTDYITSSEIPLGPPPKMKPLRNLAGAAVGGVKKSTAGVKLVIEWLGSDLQPEPIAIAEKRASICAVCPKNEDGGFFEKIGALAAQEVKALVEVRNDMELKTSQDEKLKSCTACLCWLPLKVHSPRALVQKNTSDEVRSKLDPNCWVLKEANGSL